MSKREILVLILFGAGVAFGLRYQLVACSLFTWNNIFRPLRWAKTSGIFDVRVFPSHHIVAIVLVLSLVLNPWRRRWHAGCTILLATLAWVWMGVPFAVHLDVATDFALEVTKYFIPLALIGATLSDRRSQSIYLYVLALAVGIHLAWAGFHGVFLKGEFEEQMGIPGGQMTGRNDFTVAATGCLPLLGYMAFHYRGKWQRIVRWVVLGMFPFGIAAFFYSGSRGAILGITCLLLWWAFMTGRPGKRIAIALVLATVALPMIPDFVWDRMATIEWSGQQTEGSASQRIEAMELGLQLTLDNPVIGVGPDNSWKVAADRGYRPDRPGVGVETHFIWLKCSSEHGIPMLIFFLCVIGSLLVRLRGVAAQARRTGDRETEHMATALSCAIVGFLASGTFTSKFLSEYLWSIVVLAFAFLATPRETPAAAPTPAANVPQPEPVGTPRSTRS